MKLRGDIFGVHKTLGGGRVCVKAVILTAFCPVRPWEKVLPLDIHPVLRLSSSGCMSSARYTLGSQTVTLKGKNGFI